MMKDMFEQMFSSVDSVTEIERIVYSATMKHGRGITLFIDDPANYRMQVIYETFFENHDETSVIFMLEERCRSIIAEYDMATEYIVIFMQENKDEGCLDVNFYHMRYRYIRPRVAMTA